jgi:hypothetical protein
MKTVFVMLFLLSPLYIYSQEYWSIVLDDDTCTKSYLNADLLLDDSLIILGGDVNVISCSYPVLYAYSISGEFQWRKDRFGSHALYANPYTKSGYLYCVGYNEGIYDVGGDEYLEIMKLDKAGNIVFHTIYPNKTWGDDDGSFTYIPNCVSIDYNWDIIIGSKEALVKADSWGNVKYVIEYDLPSEITNISPINNQYYLISTVLELYKTDTSGFIEESVALNDTCIKSIIHSETIYSISANQLTAYDTNLNLIGEIVSAKNVKLSDIQSQGNYVWLMGTDNENVTIWEIEGRQILDTLTFPLLLDNASLLVNGKDIVITGNSRTGQMGCYHYKLNGGETEISLPDIEISDFNIDSISISNGWYTTGYRFDLEISIRNSGMDTVHSFVVYTYLHGGMWCIHNYFYEKISGVVIEPYQSMTLHFDDLFEEIYYKTLCFECLSPNSEVEKNTANNTLCKTFQITDLGRIDPESPIRIYPVPSDEILHIEFADNACRTLEIIDPLGKVLIMKNTSDSKTSIDMRSIETGIYILRISTDQHLYCRSIIKNKRF